MCPKFNNKEVMNTFKTKFDILFISDISITVSCFSCR